MNCNVTLAVAQIFNAQCYFVATERNVVVDAADAGDSFVSRAVQIVSDTIFLEGKLLVVVLPDHI